jgi:ribosomal protein S18 acetylase RimI-like enzyme
MEKIKREDIETLCDWHKEHVTINFPDSKYIRSKFRNLLKDDFIEMESGKPVIMLKFMGVSKMIGFLWLKILNDPYKDKYCDLHYIHLLPECRGKGLGKKLMDCADEWAKKHGVKEIRLGTAYDNAASINLYQECGYKIKRVLMEKKYAD